MKKFGVVLSAILVAFFCLLLFANSERIALADREKVSVSKPNDTKKIRIVSLNCGATEIIFRLGLLDKIIARDESSVYPSEAKDIKNLGLPNALNVEGILSLKPTHVIGSVPMRGDSLLESLSRAGIKTVPTSASYSTQSVVENISAIAEMFEKVETGKKLVREIEEDLKILQSKKETLSEKQRNIKVLCLYFGGARTGLMWGEMTPLVALVKMVGAKSAIPNVPAMKPINHEGLVAAAPDVILTHDESLASIGGIEGLLKIPGIAQTPAGKNRRVVALGRSLIMSFGPRTGKAALEAYKGIFEAEEEYTPEVE